MIIGVDHGYPAIKTAHICFLSGIVRYEHEPYTNRGVLRIEGKYYVYVGCNKKKGERLL